LVGWGRARQILLLGENFSAIEAEAWGLVEKLVSLEELDAAVQHWIDSILKAGPLAVRQQKKLIRKWEDLSMRDAIVAGIPAFVQAQDSEEPSRRMRDLRRGRFRPTAIAKPGPGS